MDTKWTVLLFDSVLLFVLLFDDSVLQFDTGIITPVSNRSIESSNSDIRSVTVGNRRKTIAFR